jgi:conjugal transfer mating pair stabilization protein TraN
VRIPLWDRSTDLPTAQARAACKRAEDTVRIAFLAVLTACIERRKAYCCFNTPLARILDEKIRPQLGRGWGEADQPDCTGISVADFGRVDWNRVNLDEWLAILAETGHFPSLDNLDLDALTGNGSEFDLSGARPDAAARSQNRSDGLDTDAARREAETELWESTLPALP